MKSSVPLAFMFLPAMAFADEAIATAPILEVSPRDIISTRTVHDGKRRITFQKLDAAAMAEKERLLRPSPRAPQPVQTPDVVPAPDAKPVHFMHLGASVHIPDPGRPDKAVTLLQLWSKDGGKPVASLWVNANFLWLTGTSCDVETQEATHGIFLMATQGYEKLPESLPFPADGKTHLIIADGNPTEEQLAPIDALLARYDREKAALRTGYEERRRQSEEQQRLRQLNPPEKKDITIRYWRSDGTGNTGSSTR